MKQYRLILLRHGESLWNQENRFTGWKDIDLSENGKAEAQRAGRTLAQWRDPSGQQGIEFDYAFTSVLKRAIHTLESVLTEIDLSWIPVEKSWRLNERHYGALTGLNKSETAAKHGEEQVKIWRRSYKTPPPPMAKDSPDHPSYDRRYRDIPRDLLPNGEALIDTVERVVPYWNEKIAPMVKAGKRVLIVAHGNSIRALLKHVAQMSAEEILETNIPTAVPLELVFDENFQLLSRQYLGDPKDIENAIQSVASQGQKK